MKLLLPLLLIAFLSQPAKLDRKKIFRQQIDLIEQRWQQRITR